jgi:hypothetical protein
MEPKNSSAGPTSGLYYKHTTIINYASSIVNKLEALLTDDARVIYDRHVFIVQATAFKLTSWSLLSSLALWRSPLVQAKMEAMGLVEVSLPCWCIL